MTDGQSFKGPNDYRERFHNEVIQSADKVSSRGSPHFGENDNVSKVHERYSTS